MFALVSTDGRYHGHTPSTEDARKLQSVKESKVEGYFRREMCASLGKAV